MGWTGAGDPLRNGEYRHAVPELVDLVGGICQYTSESPQGAARPPETTRPPARTLGRELPPIVLARVDPFLPNVYTRRLSFGWIRFPVCF